MAEHVLSLVLFLPLIGMLAVLLIPARWTHLIRWTTLTYSLAGLGASCWMLSRFDAAVSGYQLVERAPWIPSLGAQYLLGVDGISVLLVMLTSVIGVIAPLCSWRAIERRQKEFYALLLLQQTATLGAFLSLDFLLFFLFFEFSLVPMYFLIGIWGGERRLYAAIKFFLYTLAGSIFLLLGGLAFYLRHLQATGTATFEYAVWQPGLLDPTTQLWIFWAFFLAFAIKVPMFPFHTWLPDAHVEAPTAGSVILAAVLLKLGTYGFVRFSLPLLPQAAQSAVVVRIIVVLSLVAILYGALVSLMQKDWKKLVAYSSVSHMGFCTLGLFTGTPDGIAGSVLQQVNHGISTGLLFLLVGIIYERRHTRKIAEFGGVAASMPKFAVIFAIACFSSAGVPLLNGFIGEMTILRGTIERSFWWATLAAIGIVLGAAYLLWLYQRTMLGKPHDEANTRLRDLTGRELAVLLPLVAWAFWIGIYPKPHLDLLRPPVKAVMERLATPAVATPPQQAQR